MEFHSMLPILLCSLHFMFSAPPAQEPEAYVRYLHSKTMFLAHYRVQELVSMPAVQQILAETPGGIAAMEQESQKTFGLAVKDFESVSIFMENPEEEQGRVLPPFPSILVITTKKIDYGKFRASLGDEQETFPYGPFEFTFAKGKAILRISDQQAIFYPQIIHKTAADYKNEAPPSYLTSKVSRTPKHWQAAVEQLRERKNVFYAAFQFPENLREQAEEGMKNAPPMAAPFKVMTKLEHAWMALQYEKGQKEDLRMQITMQFPDERSAKAGLGAVRFAFSTAKMTLNSVHTGKPVPRNLDNFWAYAAQFSLKHLNNLTPEQQGREVKLAYTMSSTEFVSLLTLAIEKVRMAADKMLSASNMRQLMIAMHNYHNDYNHMPEVMTMKDGKPLHSWRVHLLPYLEQEQLYRQLKLDEPWNSEHNKKVFESNPMPKIYEHPKMRDGASKKTYYQLLYSTTGAKKPAAMRLGARFTLGQLTVNDGTSQTAAMVEHGKPVLWYQPEDIEFDGAGKFPQLLSMWNSQRLQVAMYDASIRTFFVDRDEATWKAVFTWNGGEELDLSKIED